MLNGISLELIFIVLIVIIMVFSILKGMLQGFRKNLFNLIATIVFWVIFWLTAPLIKGNIIWKNEIIFAQMRPLLPNVPENSKCILDLILDLVKNLAVSRGADPAAVDNPQFVNTIIAILQVLAKIAWLIILAITYGTLKLIVYRSVLKRFCQGSKKRVKKLEKKRRVYLEKYHKENPKLNKAIIRETKNYENRKRSGLLGLLTGFARGAIASFLIMCVINTTIKSLPNLRKDEDEISVSTNPNESKPTLYDFILQQTGNNPIVKAAVDIIADYQGSQLINTTGLKIGNRPADEMFIDSILSGQSEDCSFALRKEISSIVQVAEYAFDLTNGFDMNSVSWTSLTSSQVDNLQKILGVLSNDDLISNLGSALVGFAMSMDAVKDYMPKEFNADEYESIDWSKDLATIATLVAQVYSLGDDLTKLDYLDLDEQLVKGIFESLSKLTSVELVGHIGASFAVKSLAKEQDVSHLESVLAQIATDKGYSNTIASFSDLYSNFKILISDIDIDEYYDAEAKKITSYVKLLTSIDPSKEDTEGNSASSNIVHIIFRNDFVSNVLPDVMSMIRDVLPEDVKSIINPGVVTSQDWEREINGALALVHDFVTDENGTMHPFEKITDYNFDLLNNFTTTTIVNSELLSYAMIKIFIDTANGEGILGASAGQIGNYLCVPDNLRQTATKTADNLYHFNNKWYGENGELDVMLSTIKNVASEIESTKYMAGSLPLMLSRINGEKLVSSDVLYYSLDKAIGSIGQYMVIPTSETHMAEQTVSGVYNEHMISRNAIKEVVDIISNRNIVDMDLFLTWYTLDAQGNRTETIVETPPDDQRNNYAAMFAFNQDSIFGLLKSNKLYNSETSDKSNLDTLFGSSILRATVSNYVGNFAGEFLAIPNGAIDSQECNVNGETKQVDVIKTSQLSALVMAVKDININLETVLNNPMDVLTAFKDETQDDNLNPKVRPILSSDDENGKYSAILHATLSKYVLDLAGDGSSTLSFVVPESARDTQDPSILTSTETLNLISALTVVGTNSFTNSSSMDDILVNIVEDNKELALGSAILRGTITNYLNTQATGFELPASVYEDSTHQVLKRQEAQGLLNAIRVMKFVKDRDSGTTSQYTDLLSVDNLSIQLLVEADDELVISEKEFNRTISSSTIIRGVLTKQLNDNTIEIPVEAYDENADDVISTDENHNLLDSLNTVFGGAKISELASQITSLKISQIKAMKNSLILRRKITTELQGQAEIIIPDVAYDTSMTTVMLLPQQIDDLVDGIGLVLGNQNMSVSEAGTGFANIKFANVYSAKDTLADSYILRATVTNKLTSYSINVPTEAYASSSLDENKDGILNVMISRQELTSFLDVADGLLSEEQKDKPMATGLDFTDISLNSIYLEIAEMVAAGDDGKSYIILSTISENIKDQSGIILPQGTYDGAYIEDTEIVNLFKALDSFAGQANINNIGTMLGGTQLIDNILTSSSINSTTYESSIFRATATAFLMPDGSSQKLSSITIAHGDLGFDYPAYDPYGIVNREDDIPYLKDYQNNNIDIISNAEFYNLICAMRKLKNVLDPDNEKNINTLIDTNNLSFASINDCKTEMLASNIIRKEISNQILNGVGSLLVVSADTKDPYYAEKYLSVDELSDFIGSMNAMFGDSKLSEKSSISPDELYGKTDEQYSDLFDSKIVLDSVSKEIKNNLQLASLTFLEDMFTRNDGEVDLPYVTKAEMISLLKALTVLKGDNAGFELSTMNLSIADDSCFIYHLTESDFVVLFNSVLISYNLRDKLVEANGTGGYFGELLSINASIPEDVTSVSQINGYKYTTVNVNNQPSEVCQLLISVVDLKNGDSDHVSYLDVLTGSISNLSKYQRPYFIETVTEDNILRDSLPGIIKKMNTVNTGDIAVPATKIDSLAFATTEESKLYWQGSRDDYADGELYCFVGFIDASSRIATDRNNHDAVAVKNDINTMLQSDIAFEYVDGALAAFGDTSAIPIEDGKRDWSSAEGQAYITTYATIVSM